MGARTLRPLAVALVVLAIAQAASAEGWRGGVGVLGDSYSDEYQFYPPDRSVARNWVEVLAQVRGVDFGPISLGSRGAPRLQGYAYNWARSDATTDDMIAEGQHTGLARQVREGAVGLVWVFIGGNDFIAAMKAADPPRAFEAALPRAVRNVEAALAAILEASADVKVVLATVPDITELPEFAEPHRAGALPKAHMLAAEAAICRYNKELRRLAQERPRVAIADLYWSTRVARMLSPQHVVVGGVRVVRTGTSNEIDHVFLADRRHIGTVVQGLMARMFIETVNSRFGAGLEPLSDREILRVAEAARRADPAIAGVGGTPEASAAGLASGARLSP
jgi:lysophospholipase L1-like esterase